MKTIIAWDDQAVPMGNDSESFDWNEEGITQLPQIIIIIINTTSGKFK